jgi:hypothetical protein
MLSNFFWCPTIGGRTIRMGEDQASPELKTEGLSRLILVYVFERMFHIIIKDWINKFFRKTIENFTVLGDNCYYKF